MKLFEEDSSMNLLPHDGEAHYFGSILNAVQSEKFYQILLKKIEWKHDEAKMFGKHIITKRKVAWYADEAFDYTYSKVTKKALVWTKELLTLKQLAEKYTQSKYNSCLLNLYHNGEEGMAYHSDDEKMLEKNGSIASLSFGAERKFLFKHKDSKETISLFLEPGSLLEMKGTTQSNWLHRLPPTKKIHTPRINLTFRKMVL